jgi:hypothetical protein
VAVMPTLLVDFVPWGFWVAGRISAGQSVSPGTKNYTTADVTKDIGPQ